MTEKIGKINNPLTIIAIFAALAEVNATVAIGLVDDSLHYIFIWFVMGFPTLLIALFFLTLNYNPKVLYSPSDFREDKNFIDSLYGPNSSLGLNEVSGMDVNQWLSDLESKLLETVNDKLRDKHQEGITQEQIGELLESQKSEIKKILDESKENVGTDQLTMPRILRGQLTRWISYPAFLPIIYAIVKEGVRTIEDLRKFESKYNLPRRWDRSGIKGLTDTIMSTSEDGLVFEDGIEEPLTKWIELNESILKQIVEAFDNEDDPEKDNVAKARLQAQKLVI